MKRVLFLTTAVLFFILALAGCGREQPAGDPEPSNELADPVQDDLFLPGDFESPSSCGSCHQEIHAAWSGSMHAAAWMNELYQPDYQKAFTETDGATEIFCGECHAPIAVRVGQLPPSDGSEFDEISKQGVSCDFCHTVSEVQKPFNVQNVSSPGPVKRGPRDDAESPAHQTLYSGLHTDPVFCAACHSVRHPQSNVAVIDTYDDWLAGPYADEGIRCQDCHMTPSPGIGQNPGRSATIGGAKEREHIATHYFVGGNSWMFSRRGYDEHAAMAEANLKAAAELALTGSLTQDGLLLTATVTNVGAGHSIPTGVTYIRQMWLEVTVTDEQGNVVFTSGHTDDDNHVDSEAIFFRKLFIDANGNETSKSWLAEEIGYDRRIPAKGSDEQTYTIQADGTSFNATVRLLYRSTTQAAVDGHMAGQNERVPSVEMAKAEIQILD
ncbi:MAG: multiheme c-type cytochrome [Bacillota bacterium]|nr:multiheme c-type cytochrome [Bacillota bacterium]MDW7683624.1 multiheme c-type cytochrome [Bacillota bacterium]